MNFRHFAALAAALSLPLAMAQPVAAQAPELAEQPWDVQSGIPADVAEAFPAIAGSDLPFDTDYRVGRLDNGMRYIIRSNATPPEQGAVHLWVDFGSTAEGEDEEGYAHFIEHMAFNGSTNLPEGEMVRLLEREGLAFGADTNASTGFDTTMYRLDLPRNDLDLLDTALMLMRETASELTFDDAAVNREKGVILSERRSRDTYQLRNLVDNLGFLFPGTAIANRLPIGTVEDIEAADGAALRDLWSRYYRPENTAIIVVGDFETDAVEAAIAEHFADWEGEPRLELPPYGPADPALAGQTRIYIDPALSEEIAVSRHGEWLGGLDTVQSRRERVLRQIGYGIVNRRLQRLSRLENPPFRAAGLGTSDLFDEGRTTTLTVRAAEGEWERGLAAAQEEYRRALEFGFTEAEVAEQVANLRTAIESNAAGAATRGNRSFVTGAITLLRDGQVPTTPASALERFTAHEPDITPETVLEALKDELVPLDNPLIRFEGRTAPDGGEAALRAAWEAGMAVELTAREVADVAEFAYQGFGEPGTVVSDTRDERLGIRTVTFDNGVMLNLKQTDLQEDRILLQLNIDGGRLLDTRENPLATAMTGFLPVGGLGEHTQDELQTILAGRDVSFNVGVTDETFRLSNTTTPRDLALQLQLWAAAVLDPAFRATGEAQYRRNVENWFAQNTATPSSALGTALGAIVNDGDPRHALQPEDAYMALSFARLRDDILERWQSGAMELAIVGDIDEDATIARVAATLGALPPRENTFGDYADNRDRRFTADRGSHTVYHDGADNSALLLMTWPTRDDSDASESLVLGLLDRVMSLELLDTMREELGQTYGPSVNSSLSRTYPGYGTFSMSAEIDVGDIDAARAAMLGTLESLRTEGVEEDTLLRARQPLLEAYDNALDSNSGWMSLVDRAQTEPERIERFLAGEERLRSITVNDVKAAALRYLVPGDQVEIIVLPRQQAPAEDSAP